MKTILKPVALACLLALASSQGVMAAGGASGAAVKYAKQGQIGEVVNNPYRIAPLTAVIRSGGYQLEDVQVRIVPKKNGSNLQYNVSKDEVLG